MTNADTRMQLFDGFVLSRSARVVEMSLAGRRVLSYLALNGRSSRLETAVTLWPDASEGKALGSLRTVLWRVNAVDRSLVAAGADWLHLRPGIRIDVHEFGAAADTVFRHDQPCLPAVADLTVGHLLPGWYDDWVVVERERIRLTQVQALEALAHLLIAGDRLAAAVQAGWAAVRCDPLRESATHVLIRAHLAQHNLVEAIRAYRALRTVLWQELRAAPSGDLTRLVRVADTPGALIGAAHRARSTA